MAEKAEVRRIVSLYEGQREASGAPPSSKYSGLFPKQQLVEHARWDAERPRDIAGLSRFEWQREVFGQLELEDFLQPIRGWLLVL